MLTTKGIGSANSLIEKLEQIEPDHYNEFIDSLLDTNTPVTIGFLNQHAYNVANQNARNLRAFIDLDYLLRDGIGIKLACLYRKTLPGANMNGTDFIPALIDRVLKSRRKVQFFVFGTESPWLEKGAKKLLRGHDYHYLHGFLDPARYVDLAQSTMDSDALKIVILAMGVPKQETLAWVLRRTTKGPALIVCGGAIIDFQAGRFKRAPFLFRKLGLEWLYRLALEPKRLGSRYVIGIPKFLVHVLIGK